MAFLEGEIKLNLYADSAQTEFPQQLIPSYAKTWMSTSVDEAQTNYINLAASGTQAFTLNGVGDVQGIMIYSDAADLTITINGGTAMTYKAAVPGFMPLVVTSLSITNASASVATNVLVQIISG